MSRSTPSSDLPGSDLPLTALREPDVSGLALWSALFVASSALLAFFATEPAQAWPNAQPVSASAADAAAPTAPVSSAGQASLRKTLHLETGGDPGTEVRSGRLPEG